ncbi:unnamed protein product [Thelazia callipaeda]|uniref:DC_STAMP domain-containing protein n=1 Tax=Thelazia callipaeda TaxID=103827 RepID=A0A158RCZ3_THECL|nr:unnamed protein product [Thelazia callipaeda]
MLINVLRKPKLRALKKLREFQFIAENCRRSYNGERLLVDTRKKFWTKCGRFFPLLYPDPKPTPRNAYERVFTYGTRENDVSRIVLSFLTCEFVGLLFFISIALKYSAFPSRLGVYVGIAVQCVLGLMIPFPSLRATILIASTKLSTNRLRSIIIMFIISWSFQVSAMNTTKNLELLAESVACVRDSAIRVGNELVAESNMQNNKFSMPKLKEFGHFFIQNVRKFRNTVRKLQDVVTKFGKQTKDFMVQLLSVKDFCHRFFIGPYYYCLRVFDDAAQFCDRLTIYRGFSGCKFIKDMKSICEVARFNEMVCMMPGKMKEGLSSGVLTLAKDKMKNTLNNVLDGYNMSFFIKEAKAAKKTWEEIGISINHTLEQNQTQSVQLQKMREELQLVLNKFEIFVDILSQIIKLIISNLIVLTLLTSLLYTIKYKRHEEADNVYITEEFRNIDMMREAQGQPSLLPLLPSERHEYIEGFTLHMTTKEKVKMLFAFAITLIGGFLPVFLVLLDIFTYKMLYFTYSFLQSNTTRTERLNHYILKVSGEGFVAKLLQRILELFNPITKKEYSDDSWRQCFMEPNPPDLQLIRLMLFLYFIAIVLCIVQIYIARFRRLIAQHYWPERTMPRALWLYNKILEGRKNILSQMLRAAKEKQLREELAEDELNGRGQLVTRGLSILGAEQYKCTRCFKPDLRVTDASNARVCPNCNSLYCTDCYAVRQRCLNCGASLQAVLKEVDFYVDSSCEEEEVSEETGEADSSDYESLSKTGSVQVMYKRY